MTVTLGNSDGFVTIHQSRYLDEPENLKPDEARSIARQIIEIADEIEE
jgi:hypothetical protein